MMNQSPGGSLAVPPLLPTHKDRRGWLIAFGVIEILIACFFLLMAGFLAAFIPHMPKPPGQPEVPGGIFYVIGAFYGLLGAVFAAAGIGSIQARNWARILMIVLSSLWLAFGTLGTVGMIVVMPLMMRQQETILRQNPAAQAGQLPPNFMTGVMVTIVIFQILIMVLLPLIFLIFYTRKNVKATCEGLSASASSAYPAASFSLAAAASASGQISGAPVATPQAKGLPIPIILAIGWFLFASLSFLITAGWLPLTILFGVTLRGFVARLALILFAVVNVYCAWNFYKLRIQGWWTALVLFGVSLLSGIMTAIQGIPLNLYDEVYRQMGIYPQQVRFTLDPKMMSMFQLMGLLVYVVVAAFIVYTRRCFAANQTVN